MKRNDAVKFKKNIMKNMDYTKTIQKEIRDVIRATHAAEEQEEYKS